MKYYLMIVGETFDTDPDMEGPFTTLEARTTRGIQLCEAMGDEARVYSADVSENGHLAVYVFE